MIITVRGPDWIRKARLPYPGAEFVHMKGPCPSCGHAGLVRVRGSGQTTTYDCHLSRAVALCCGQRIGELRVQVSTVFGIEEDQRVLLGRCRVY